MPTRISVEPELYRWACKVSGKEPGKMEAQFSNLSAWISGQKEPTYRQLKQFAKATFVPFGDFFLSEPRERTLPITDFRSVPGSRSVLPPSANLIDTIYTMQRRQAWLRDKLVEDGMEPLVFVGSAHRTDPPADIARSMRQTLGVEDGWASLVKNWTHAVGELRRRIDGIGIMVVINGIVGNNTHRRLSVDEFRGFALSDRYAPLIFINGADARSAQMFTMAHELAHIWLGSDGVSQFERLSSPDVGIERWCNRVAAEFLVPERALREEWDFPEPDQLEACFQRLAREFKVSPLVIALRAKELKLINREEFKSFYDQSVDREHKKKSNGGRGGGDFYKVQNARVGEYFARHIVWATQERRIDFTDALELTNLKDHALKRYAAKELAIEL